MSSLAGISKEIENSVVIVNNISTDLPTIHSELLAIEAQLTETDGYLTNILATTSLILTDNTLIINSLDESIAHLQSISLLNDVTDITNFTTRINLTAISWNGTHHAKKIQVVDGGNGLLLVTTEADQQRFIKVFSGDEIFATNIKVIHQGTDVNKLRIWWSAEDVSIKTVPFVPSDVTGNIIWLRADLGADLEDANLMRLYDMSGEQNNAIQATVADQPEFLRIGGINDTSGIIFDSANTEYLDLGAAIGEVSNDYTIFAVLDQDTLGTDQCVLYSDSVVGNLGAINDYESAGTSYVGIDDNGVSKTISPAQLGAQWLEWHWDSVALKVRAYRNGILLGDAAYNGTSTIANQTNIGKNPGAASHYGNYTLAELIVYNNLISANDLDSVRDYISNRYNL